MGNKSKIYILLIVFVLFVGLFPQNAVADLISRWKFNETSGPTASDSVGSNPGTVTGAQWIADGKFDGALSFDGDNDYVLVGDKADLEQQEFTLSFWAQLNNPSDFFQGGVAKGNVFGASSEFSYMVGFHNGTVWAEITNTSDIPFIITVPINDNDWHMWTLTAGDGTLTLYKDGQFQDNIAYTGTIDYTKSNNNFVVGARDNGIMSFDGKIDDVRFYNEVLTYGEIQQLLTASDKAAVPNPADYATGVDPNVTLSWIPSEHAALHNIYFGTDFNDVNTATIGSAEDMGSQAPNSWSVTNYNPAGLDYSTTYFWRIDEVNDPCVWTGDVWRFTTKLPDCSTLTADYTGDCNVNYKDLEVIAQYWLATDYDVTAQQPSDANLKVHYAFDQIAGKTVIDSSANAYHATIDANDANTVWDTNGLGDSGCVDFNGLVTILIPSDVFADINEQVTLSVWISNDANQDANSTIAVQFDTNTPDLNYSESVFGQISGPDPKNTWDHYAAVKDANSATMRIYLNGLLIAQNTDAAEPIQGSIAGESTIEGKDFRLDELKIYDCALDHSQILYLVAGPGSQIHQPLQPALSTIDPFQDGIIYFKDFAIFVEDWMKYGE